MRKVILCLVLTMVLALTSFGEVAYAYQPDRTYVFDEDGAVPSTNIYQVSVVVDENVMGCGRLRDPKDIFVDSKDNVYVLDSGNCRILILNDKYRCTKELKEFRYNGEILTLAEGARGIFYRESNKCLYIADTENNRVIVSDLDGNVSKVYGKPVDELLDPAIPYKPYKIIVDNMGIMYITSGLINTGALLVDSENNFLGFYGTNKIKETMAVVIEYMWRSILTDEQNAQSTESFQPVEFTNLFWSEDRFVYAVSPYNDTVESTMVKLNALGNNVFPVNMDFTDIIEKSGEEGMILADVTVDNEGAVTIVDMTSGKLFQYDEGCNLMAVFGGVGYQKGLFIRPTGLESDSKNNLLVLDEGKNTITVMEQTYYGKMIRGANYLYNQGLYEESIEPWFEVIRMNANYSQAYVGLGKAYMSLGDYEAAMNYFEIGQDQQGYGEAKAALRNEKIRENFALIAAIVCILMFVVLAYDYLKKQVIKLFRLVIKRRGEKA